MSNENKSTWSEEKITEWLKNCESNQHRDYITPQQAEFILDLLEKKNEKIEELEDKVYELVDLADQFAGH